MGTRWTPWQPNEKISPEDEMREQLEFLNTERNQLLSHFTTLYSSWIVYDRTQRANEAAVLVIEVEAGQISFPLKCGSHKLFAHLKVKHSDTWERKTPDEVQTTLLISQAALRIYPQSLAEQCLNNFSAVPSHLRPEAQRQRHPNKRYVHEGPIHTPPHIEEDSL